MRGGQAVKDGLKWARLQAVALVPEDWMQEVRAARLVAALVEEEFPVAPLRALVTPPLEAGNPAWVLAQSRRRRRRIPGH